MCGLRVFGQTETTCGLRVTFEPPVKKKKKYIFVGTHWGPKRYDVL